MLCFPGFPVTRQAAKDQETMLKKRIRDIQSAGLVSVSLDSPVREAVGLMRERGISCVPVLEDGRAAGMFTERAVVRLAASGEPFLDRPMREVMSAPAVCVSPDALGHEAYSLLQARRLRHLAVADENGRCLGVVSQSDIVANMGYENFVQLRKVSGEMIRAVSTAAPDDSVMTALRLMASRGISCVLVEEDGAPAGIITERDAAGLALGGTDLDQTPLREVMSAPVATVSPGTPVHEALALMRRRKVRRLAAVNEDGRLAGVLTQTDVVNSMEWQYVEILNEIIRDKEERFLNIFLNSVEGIFQASLSGRLLTANPAMARIFGFASSDQLLYEAHDFGERLFADKTLFSDIAGRLALTSDPLQCDARCLRGDGTAIWVSFSFRMARDNEGAPLFIDGFCMDVTSRKKEEERLREREARYRSIVEDQSELICRYRPDGRLSFVNEAYARYYGKKREELINANFVPHIPEEDMRGIADGVARLSVTSPTARFEHRIVMPDGETRWQAWTHRAIFDPEGTLAEYQAVGNDVTDRKRAEEALQSQCNLLNTLMEALPTPVFFKDAAGVYQGCNAAFEKALGVRRENVIGKTVFELSPRELAEVYHARDQELLSSGGAQSYEAGVRGGDGTIHQVIFNKAGYVNAAGETAGLVGVITDITERKRDEDALKRLRDDLEDTVARRTAELRSSYERLEREALERGRAEEELRDSDNFLETVINAIQDGISVLDKDMTILRVNPAMRVWYGRGNAAGIEGRKCFEVYHGRNEPCRPCPSLRSLHDGRLHCEAVPKMVGGVREGWLELFSYPIVDEAGDISGVVEFVRDITERKKLEGEFIEAMERAEEASKAKSLFLANMSHEIRTPLNAVLGYIQLVLHGELESRQRERLCVAEESAETLLAVINDVLDYSKIEAGKLEIKQEAFNLRILLETLVREQEALAMSKDLPIRLSIDTLAPSWLKGDPLRLRQILRNLLNNAVKYTERGNIDVEVQAAYKRPDEERTCDQPIVRLLFTVSDTGIGIPAADQDRIFDSFTQVDSGLSKRHAGTGLGLAICKKLSELMGGSMWFESEEGQGSAFYFSASFESLEAECRDEADWRPLKTPANDIGRLNILLAEDNRINQMFAVDLLESRGHRVTVAENGLEALKALEKDVYDVTLMDIQMPVMNGVEATRAIRAHDGSAFDPNIPIIGLSAFAMDQERDRFLAEGLDGYITKPINIESFFDVMARALGRGNASGGGACASPETGRDERTLDTAALFIQYRNKRELLRKVGREFMVRIPEYAREMGEAFAQRNMEPVTRLAHVIKGNASLFGAYRLRSLAIEAERLAGEEDWDALDGALASLLKESDDVVAALDDFIKRLC